MGEKMTPAMTLALFASVIKSGEAWSPTCQRAMDEAMYFLATPAQTVDVEALREVINEMRHPTKQNFVSEWAGKLSQAIGDKT